MNTVIIVIYLLPGLIFEKYQSFSFLWRVPWGHGTGPSHHHPGPPHYPHYCGQQAQKYHQLHQQANMGHFATHKQKEEMQKGKENSFKGFFKIVTNWLKNKVWLFFSMIPWHCIVYCSHGLSCHDKKVIWNDADECKNLSKNKDDKIAEISTGSGAGAGGERSQSFLKNNSKGIPEVFFYLLFTSRSSPERLK